MAGTAIVGGGAWMLYGRPAGPPQGAPTVASNLAIVPAVPDAHDAGSTLPNFEGAQKVATDTFGVYADLVIPGSKADFRMRWIEPGTFTMGSPEYEAGRDGDEGPQHEVTLTAGFWLADAPCTQAVYKAVTGKNPSGFQGRDRPVERVSWNDAQVFLSKLNQRVSGAPFVLPTEAQWEYACRAGTTDARYDVLDSIAWHPGNAEGGTHPVRQKQPNAWGLYDMLGNVYEWCQDEQRSYSSQAQRDPMLPDTGGGRVIRGGSWLAHARLCRAALRGADPPSFAGANLGFRFARGQAAPGGPEGL